MSLIKWNKDELFPTFNTFWDDFFNKDFFNKGLELGTSIPAVNVAEEEGEFSIEVAIPGGKKEDFDIDIDNNILTISSEKKEEKEEKDGKRITRREFSYSSFKRSFYLPESVNKEAISASYDDGILRINLPKLEIGMAAERKKIEVS